MQGRIAAGIGAWVIGAVSATALSLLAVSVFGRSAASSRGPVLSQSDIAAALASATAPGASQPPTPSASSPGESANQQPATTVPTPALSASASSPPSSTPTPPVPVRRVLSSVAGTVVARGQGSQRNLDAWRPAQG